MFRHLLSLFISLPLLSFAQNRLLIEADLDSIKRKIHFDAFGANVERMHYRTLDDQGNMPDEILEDMLEAEDIIYRWPGGATANFYHFFEGTSKGYGLLREEINAVEHPMRCDLPASNPNCMSFEQYAPTNYIYNLLDYSDKYYERFKKNKKVVWLPNIFTFYLNNKTEIQKLRDYNSYEEITLAFQNGEISADFYKRLKDVFDVYDILSQHPTIDLVGIEYGNEFYFHEPTAGAKYNLVNNPLIFALQEQNIRAILREHISYYTTIVKFYERSFEKKGPKIPAAAPAAIITNTGSQANMHLLWNEGIRDSILPYIDGIVHHFYFKRNDGPRIDPRNAEDLANAADLDKIKTLSDNFIHERVPQVDLQYEKFFKLTENGKKMWMTEFNTDNGYFDGFFAEWQNTFFHSYYQFESFVSFIDNVHNTDVIRFAFPHLWVSYIDDYNYGAYAAKVEPNGSYKKIKRTTYSAYDIIGSLAKREIRQINFNVSNTDSLARKELFVKTYFEPIADLTSQYIGNLIVVFSNKSGKPIFINPLENISFQDTSGLLEMKNMYAQYLNAPHIYSSNGKMLLDSNGIDADEVINVYKESDIDIQNDYKIDGYAVGYLSIPIYDLSKVVTSISPEQALSGIEIYPNPSQNTINISAKNVDLFSVGTKYTIIDATGKTVQAPILRVHPQLVKVNISSLPSGNYFIHLEKNQQQKAISFIKQ